MLNATGISFHYPQTTQRIFDDFSISIESGERVGLLAPSGFGKTTLCKVLSGYEKPETGTITLDDKLLNDYKGYCPVQMIWQHPEQVINPRLRMRTVLDEGNQIDEHIWRGVGIETDWMSRYPTELSGGELQRFCIARALGEGTRFILADEISTMLDLITQSQIWNYLLEETKHRGIGLLAVSHVPALLERVCTRIVKLQKS